MLALFHDKKCCNCSYFVPCILWDFIVLSLVLRLVKTQAYMKNQWISREACEKLSRERAREEHMTGSWRVVSGCRFHDYLAGKAFPRDSSKTFCLEDFYVWIPYPSPIPYIPSLPTNTEETISERKPLDRFSTTHTHPFFRERVTHL